MIWAVFDLKILHFTEVSFRITVEKCHSDEWRNLRVILNSFQDHIRKV